MKRPYPNEPNVVRYTEEEIKEMIARGEDKTDWKRVENMRDEEVAIDEDSPEITEEMMANAEVIRRPKEIVTLRLDTEVLEWFKAQGKGYQTRINAVLKAYMKARGERR
jgi:uncharacterized protein (DUF4415 family)